MFCLDHFLASGESYRKICQCVLSDSVSIHNHIYNTVRINCFSDFNEIDKMIYTQIMFILAKKLCITVLKCHKSVSVFPLLLWMSIWTLFSIETVSFRYMLPISLLRYHIWMSVNIIISMVVQACFISRCFTILLKFSMEFRSGQLPGYSNIFIPLFWNTLCIFSVCCRWHYLREKLYLHLVKIYPLLGTDGLSKFLHIWR